MSEERTLILQMLADGKISADEADKLLQAIEESERTAQETVVESAQRTERPAGGLADLGKLIDSAVSEATRTLDQSLRSLEGRLQTRGTDLKDRVEERIRRSTERALERVMEAEQRAAQAAERAARRMEELAERDLRRDEKRMQREQERLQRETERLQRETEHMERGCSSPKVGIQIDRVTVERTDRCLIQALPGDQLVLDNRVGDVAVEFYDGDQIEVAARKTVWGRDEADASDRARETLISVMRRGQAVQVEISRPTLRLIGVVHMKDTRIDFTIRLPRGTHLKVVTKVGNIRVDGDKAIGTWELASQVGDVDLRLPQEAQFQYNLKSRVGRVIVDLAGGHVAQSESPNVEGEPVVAGAYGEGGGRIEVKLATGDIRLHH